MPSICLSILPLAKFRNVLSSSPTLSSQAWRKTTISVWCASVSFFLFSGEMLVFHHGFHHGCLCYALHHISQQCTIRNSPYQTPNLWRMGIQLCLALNISERRCYTFFRLLIRCGILFLWQKRAGSLHISSSHLSRHSCCIFYLRDLKQSLKKASMHVGFLVFQG